MLQNLKAIFKREKFRSSPQAYDSWSGSYDDQPGNLMLDLDEEVFSDLLQDVPLKDRQVIDVGCGTGRHWQKLRGGHPSRLTGFDSSAGMLEKLKEKYPGAEVYHSADHRLEGIKSGDTDLVVSTLTIAHIKNPADYFTEWKRVLKPGGEIILTDYHPAALGRGAKRTFTEGGKTVAIKNYIHPLDEILKIMGQLGLTQQRLVEKKIDEKVQTYYEKQNALQVFEAFRGVPIIYGILLKKPDGTA